jgi:hypothetical protein
MASILIRGLRVLTKGALMSSVNTFKFTDGNGNESTKNVTSGMTLGKLLSSSQQGLIDGVVSDNSTTIRPGDHVEVIIKSGKAGA